MKAVRTTRRRRRKNATRPRLIFVSTGHLWVGGVTRPQNDFERLHRPINKGLQRDWLTGLVVLSFYMTWQTFGRCIPCREVTNRSLVGKLYWLPFSIRWKTNARLGSSLESIYNYGKFIWFRSKMDWLTFHSHSGFEPLSRNKSVKDSKIAVKTPVIL